jgi:hypothetical protein
MASNMCVMWTMRCRVGASEADGAKESVLTRLRFQSMESEDVYDRACWHVRGFVEIAATSCRYVQPTNGGAQGLVLGDFATSF